MTANLVWQFDGLALGRLANLHLEKVVTLCTINGRGRAEGLGSRLWAGSALGWLGLLFEGEPKKYIADGQNPQRGAATLYCQFQEDMFTSAKPYLTQFFFF